MSTRPLQGIQQSSRTMAGIRPQYLDENASTEFFDAAASKARSLVLGPMAAINSPRQNQLLAALPSADYARLLPCLELISMRKGWLIHEAGEHIEWIYFPTNCLVSLGYTTENGASAAVAMTGHEGLVGGSLVLGCATTPTKALVQSAGFAYRLKAQHLKREFESGSSLQALALAYLQSMVTQMVQTAVCNRFHSVDHQLCRWLLMARDRLPSDDLLFTQEAIATELGVRRESVTAAAGKLQAEGLIHYSRGHITVLDRDGLKKQACECYAVVHNAEQKHHSNTGTTIHHTHVRPTFTQGGRRNSYVQNKLQKYA